MTAAPRPELRPLLARDYAGFSDGSVAHQLVLPATAAVPLILRIHDPADRPPAFVLGVHGSYLTMPEACAPSYVEVWLAPLGAYSVLGLPMTEIRGYTVEATGEAILAVVDAEQPPLRVFFGAPPVQIVRERYAERLATWDAWAHLSRVAQGNRTGYGSAESRQLVSADR